MRTGATSTDLGNEKASGIIQELEGETEEITSNHADVLDIAVNPDAADEKTITVEVEYDAAAVLHLTDDDIVRVLPEELSELADAYGYRIDSTELRDAGETVVEYVHLTPSSDFSVFLDRGLDMTEAAVYTVVDRRGWSLEEAADKHGVAEDEAKQILEEAREKLRDWYDAQ